jgi:beta-glucosidase
MKDNLIFVTAMSLLLFSCSMPRDEESKIDALLSKMTLEEKAAQMLNLGLPSLLTGSYWDLRTEVTFDRKRFADYIENLNVGSIHNTVHPHYLSDQNEWFKIVKTIQDASKNNTRLGIPILYGIDNIHGANYVKNAVMFPHQIGLAATRNQELVQETARITSYESRAASLPWTYNPNADVSSSPLWGRIAESFGEDPYLVSQMTASYIRGAQGARLADETSTAVCVKHYLGYGAGANGKDRANAIIPESTLRQRYIPPFAEAIANGAMSVMISSNAVNGIPCHTNSYYINDILKGELGFEGVVLSDFSDIEFLVDAHEVAETKEQATWMSINAGLDMIMNPYDADIVKFIVEGVETGQVSQERIDDAVRRILRLKFRLNLFEKPYNDPKYFPNVGSEIHIETNYQAAAESLTLLKNDGILPLETGQTILVTGYAANSINVLNGAWSRTFLGQLPDFNDPTKPTILEAIQSINGKNHTMFGQGTDYLTDVDSATVVRKARNADVIVVCVGELPATEKPSDINELELPAAQQELVHKLSTLGKPIVMVMVQGRPRIIREIEPLANAIVMAYLPGQEGGRAIADALFGAINPSGKLPYTYPKYGGNILPYYHKKTDVRDVNWGFDGFDPQYPFGHGLSYTNFALSQFQSSSQRMLGSERITLSVSVTNTGSRQGKTTVELYCKDLIASMAPDAKKMIRFEKISLEPKETKRVQFTISKEDLGFVNAKNEWTVEPGTFRFFVGTDPNEPLEIEMEYALNEHMKR